LIGGRDDPKKTDQCDWVNNRLPSSIKIEKNKSKDRGEKAAKTKRQKSEKKSLKNQRL